MDRRSFIKGLLSIVAIGGEKPKEIENLTVREKPSNTLNPPVTEYDPDKDEGFFLVMTDGKEVRKIKTINMDCP